MLSSINVQGGIFTSTFQKSRISHVVLDQLTDLRLAFRRIQSFRCALNRVTHPIELSGMPSGPQTVQTHSLATVIRPRKLLRNHDKGTTRSSETTVLGKGPKLDRTLTGSLNLIN